MSLAVTLGNQWEDRMNLTWAMNVSVPCLHQLDTSFPYTSAQFSIASNCVFASLAENVSVKFEPEKQKQNQYLSFSPSTGVAYTIASIGKGSLKSIGQAESGKAAHGRLEHMNKGRSPCVPAEFLLSQGSLRTTCEVRTRQIIQDNLYLKSMKRHFNYICKNPLTAILRLMFDGVSGD